MLPPQNGYNRTNTFSPHKGDDTNEAGLEKLLSNWIQNYNTEVKDKKYPFQYLLLIASVHKMFRCLGELAIN